MKPIRPEQAMLDYLDTELAAPSQPARRVPRAAVVAIAAALFIFVIVFAAVALAQEPATTARPAISAAPPTITADISYDSYVTMFGVSIATVAAIVLALRRYRRPLQVVAPRRPSRPVLLAADSRAAGRPRNEDACASVRVRDYQVLVVADGLGGVPGGARAATIAVRIATRVLRRRLRMPIARTCEELEGVLRDVFFHVEAMLASEARETGLDRFASPALCTTLLVVVGTARSWVTGAIGDGAVVLRRSSGDTLQLFVPQKAEGEPWILDACLGPTLRGKPVFAVHARDAGDIALVMTDGVADRVVLEDLAERVGDRLRATRDAMVVVGELLDDVESRPDVFDDNASVALAWSGP